MTGRQARKHDTAVFHQRRKTIVNQKYSLPFTVSDLQRLRSCLQGSAFVPGDDDYEQACLVWETFTFRQHPAIVVMPASAADVLTAVLFAREHHLPIQQ